MNSPPSPTDKLSAVRRLLSDWEVQLANGHHFPTSKAEQRMLLSYIRTLEERNVALNTANRMLTKENTAFRAAQETAQLVGPVIRELAKRDAEIEKDVP